MAQINEDGKRYNSIRLESGIKAEDRYSVGDLILVWGDPWVNNKKEAAVVYTEASVGSVFESTFTVTRGTLGIVLDIGNRGNGAYDDEVQVTFTSGITGWIEIGSIENISRT